MIQRKPPYPEGDLSHYSMTELFRIDAENQLTTLSENLLALASSADPAPLLEELMRAAHSLKGAARVVNLDHAVTVAHAMEDLFVQAQQSRQIPSHDRIDFLLGGTDLLRDIIFSSSGGPSDLKIDAFTQHCRDSGDPIPNPVSPRPAEPNSPSDSQTRSLRIDSDHLDRLVALAGETRITLHLAGKFNLAANQAATLQQNVRDLAKTTLPEDTASPLWDALSAAETKIGQLRATLEDYIFQIGQLGNRLYTEALACRLRPFSDCALSLRRLVHDLSRSQGKPCRLEIRGETTEIDRDILEKLEAPLTHLIQNAIDHGIESTAERTLMGKPEVATLILSVAHVSGRLVIRLTDDGRGIDIESVRKRIIDRGLISASSAAELTVSETLEFLFLPGFSLRENVSELSGRGIGLDAVRTTARQLRGAVRPLTTRYEGSSFELSLPVSQAIARCLLVSVAGTPCALPLSRIRGVFRLTESQIETTEGRPHCQWNGHRIGLVHAAQVLDFTVSASPRYPLPVVVLEDAGDSYGVIVEDFLGEQELLLQSLDHLLGKIRDLSAVALMTDGTPILVLDDEDFLLSIRNLSQQGKLRHFRDSTTSRTARKHILVVDDSLTVRELERKLLTSHGYEVTTALDGIDGWNTLRENTFDLVVTDVDMPRMDGIELVSKIRASPQWRDLPVMIVSYKDRPEDRQRGLDAGADYYLAKSSFHSDELAIMVKDLIGPVHIS